ncbi:MAG: hypothetical protein ACTSYI_13975 [Promethearchaeota archaeon]
MNTQLHSMEEIEDTEIGIALSHYHNKLGPQFVGISFNFIAFDSISQYNILQDSISSRSNDLALFVENKRGTAYTIRIKKINIKDPSARGGVQRYGICLMAPSNLFKFELNMDEISEDIVEKLSAGANINMALKAWYTMLNDTYGRISSEEPVAEVRPLMTRTRALDMF